MSNSLARNLNLESQRIIQILIDKLRCLSDSYDFTDEVDLFTKACLQTDIKFYPFFREDISNIILFSCQLIINSNICLMSASGNSEDESYRNAIQKFIDYSLTQRNQTCPPTDEPKYSFADEISDNCKDMDAVDYFRRFCKRSLAHTNSVNGAIKYEIIKKELNSNADYKLTMSESYRQISEISTICWIFLNGNLLLQQGIGSNKQEALENAVTNMFEAYSVLPDPIVTDNEVNEYIGKNAIIKLMAKTYEQNRANSLYHWETINKCAEQLKFPIHTQFINKKYTVKICGKEILETYCESEYYGQVKACKDLLLLFAKASKEKSIPKENGTAIIRKTTDSHDERVTIIKRVIESVREIREKGSPNDEYWSLVNNEFLKEDRKLELQYKTDSVTQKTICSFTYQGVKIVSSEGVNRNCSREAAAKDLVNDVMLF